MALMRVIAIEAANCSQNNYKLIGMRHIILLYQIMEAECWKKKESTELGDRFYPGSYLENGENVRKNHSFEKLGMK